MQAEPVSPATAHSGHRYRADIDGLRAIAVLSILMNHVGVRGFGGGYVGVDIFFVISGFLITGIIARDVENGRFSIGDFYRRRILRIFPALFAMLIAVSVFALLALMPGELVAFAKSVAASTVFASNILFYSEAGYFDTASHAKPLLHTWSLGIEEQFYIIWPWLLVAATALRARILPYAIAAFVTLSLLLSIWLVQSDPTAAFYLLPARGWELGLGGLLAVSPFAVRSRWFNECAALLGFALIAFAVWRFFQPINFPGLAALVPCGGAALLIFSGPDTLVGKVLSLRPAVFVGQISYSLYLWHWPVIVFAELWLFLEQTPAIIAAEIALSFGLAILSWRFVETPFRIRSRIWPSRTIFWSGAGAMAMSCGVAMMMSLDDGLSTRFTPEQRALDRFAADDYEAYFRRGTCFIIAASDNLDRQQCLTPRGDRPAVLLVGDSMAAHYWPGLSRYRDRFDILQATMAGCRPNIYPADSNRRCEQVSRDILLNGLSTIRKSALLVISGSWQPEDLPLLDQTVRQLKRQRVKFLLVGPVPQYNAAVPRLLAFADRNGDPKLVGDSLLPETLKTDATMARMAREQGIAYFSPVELLCQGGTCRTLGPDGLPLQFDYGHLAPGGSAFVVKAMVSRIEGALR